MKKLVKILLILVIISLLGGCGDHFSQDSMASSLVESITITCESCDSFTRRYFVSPEKVRLILLCIRKLGPDFPARTDVDTLDGKTLHISLACADGSRITYRIKNNQFVRKNAGAWRQIDPESAAGFYQLILETPSDENPKPALDPLQDAPGRRAYFPALRILQE